MNRTVPQSSSVDLPACGLAYDAISSVDYIEEFVRALCQMRSEFDVDFGTYFVGYG